MDLWEHFAFVLSASTGSMLTLTRQDSAWEFQSCHVRKEWCTRAVGGTSLLSSGLPRTSWHLKLKRPPLHTNRFQRPKEPLAWSSIVCSNSYTTDLSNPTLVLNKTISFKKKPCTPQRRIQHPAAQWHLTIKYFYGTVLALRSIAASSAFKSHFPSCSL